MSVFFGKYRGRVENNVDPLNLGRVQVSVPAVLGQGRLSWAMPCVLYAGPGVGFFAIPPVGANLWVEFEGGDPDYPIWSGCFWGTGEVPASPAVAEVKMLKTQSITMTLSDLPGSGGFTLEVGSPITATPFKIVVDATGIELNTGTTKVKLTTVSVSINDGALEVI